MAEKNNTSEALNKQDLLTILEVNSKSITIQTEVAAQYEEVLTKIDDINDKVDDGKQNLTTLENKLELKFQSINDLMKENHKEKIKKFEELDKEIYKIKILFIGSIISLIAQIVQIFIKH